MALITCPDCGSQISDKADRCIHCGCPLNIPQKDNTRYLLEEKTEILPVVKKPKGNNNNRLLVAFVVVLLVLIGVATFFVIKKLSDKNDIVPTQVSFVNYQVSELENDLKQDASRAKEKYNEQFVAVTGILRGLDARGEYMKVSSDETVLETVLCKITSESVRQNINSYHTGDTIIVKGQILEVDAVHGYTMDVYGSSLKATKTEVAPEEPKKEKKEKKHSHETKVVQVPVDNGTPYQKSYSNDDYFIHNGSYRTLDEARAHMRHSDEEICRVYIPSGKRKGTHYRIVIGPYSYHEEADADGWNYYDGEYFEVLSGKQMRKYGPVFLY